MGESNTRRRRGRPRSIAILLGFGICLLAGVASPPAVAAPPANDDFADAVQLSGDFDFALNQTNSEATKEAGEPEHDGNEGGASVWYSWTAPEAGDATVDTCDSNFDTVIAVYIGTDVASLSEVTSDDDGCGEGPSFADFSAVAGQTYRIAVDGYDLDGSGAETGDFDVYVELTSTGPPPPPPAQCSDGGDNDGDGKVDLADPGCSGGADNDETNPAPPPPVIVADTTAPIAALSGKKSQKAGRSVRVGVSCPTEACIARATGSIDVPGARGARRIKLGAASAPIARGEKATLKLKVSRKTLRTVKRALRRGKKVRAKTRVTVRDAAGNQTVKRRAIRLTR